jgi:hypothetical protein
MTRSDRIGWRNATACVALPPDPPLGRLDRGAVPDWPCQVAAGPAAGNILHRIVR